MDRPVKNVFAGTDPLMFLWNVEHVGGRILSVAAKECIDALTRCSQKSDRIPVTVVFVLGKDLNVGAMPTTKEILEAAGQRGLIPMPVDAATDLVAYYRSQPHREVLVLATEPVCGNKLFIIESGDHRRLSMDAIDYESRFHPDTVWAFQASTLVSD